MREQQITLSDPNYIKYQTCALADALVRNVNENFLSVSFAVLEKGDVQTKIVLASCGPMELDYVDDLIVEFAAPQVEDVVLRPIVEIGDMHEPFEHLVYSKSKRRTV